MKKHILLSLMVLSFLLGTFSGEAYAQKQWIVDILSNPARYWNVSVTVVGQVQNTTPNPIGTTRGTYTLIDDSCTDRFPFITVKSKDLPPEGKSFEVTGLVIQDPNNATRPIINEIKRTSPGMPTSMKYILIGGGVLFLFLLIIFIVLLTRPKAAPKIAATARPAVRPPAPAPESRPTPTAAPPVVEPPKTRKVPTSAEPTPEPDKTRAFMSLGGAITIEKGPDKDKQFTLHKQVTTIGRAGARKNDIELTDDTISKEQSSIFYDNTTREFSISNESTTNPTMVNKKIITESIVLKDNDDIEAGETVLRFKKE